MKINSSASILIFINMAGLVILLFFQYLMFAFLPAIDQHTPLENQRNESISYILSKNIILAIEAVVVLAILFFINHFVLKISTKQSILLFFIELILLLTTMYFFSMDYINKFPFVTASRSGVALAIGRNRYECFIPGVFMG